MNNLLTRRMIGLLVIIFGAISGILLIVSSTKINASLIILLSAIPQYSQVADSISSICGAISLIFMGFSFGIVGICLALGSMVYKIGGKEKITLSLKEDGLEAAVSNKDSNFEKHENTHLSLESKQIKNEKQNIKADDEISHEHKKAVPKNFIILLIAILLLIGNIIMFIVMFKK